MSTNIKTITTSELRRLRSAKTDMLLVDVLSKEQFAKDHIEGAKNLPFDGADFLPSMARAAGTKGKKIVVYCAGSSCKTSSDAARALTTAGYSDVHAFEGGLAEWRSSEKGARGGDDKVAEMQEGAGAVGTPRRNDRGGHDGGKPATETPAGKPGGSIGSIGDPDGKQERKAGGR